MATEFQTKLEKISSVLSRISSRPYTSDEFKCAASVLLNTLDVFEKIVMDNDPKEDFYCYGTLSNRELKAYAKSEDYLVSALPCVNICDRVSVSMYEVIEQTIKDRDEYSNNHEDLNAWLEWKEYFSAREFAYHMKWLYIKENCVHHYCAHLYYKPGLRVVVINVLEGLESFRTYAIKYAPEEISSRIFSL